MIDKFTIAIPYSEVFYGDILMQVETDHDGSREDFIKCVQNGTIDPFNFVKGDETFTVEHSDEQDVSYKEARIIK